MGETSPDVVKQVEGVMRLKLANVVQHVYSAAGGVKSLADILNQADRPTERNVLDSLSTTDEELGEEVRRLLFVFEDIAKLDDRSIQMVLREADQKDLALALRGVSDEVRDRILGNMSERGAQMLREEMEFQPPQRKRVVEEAQGRIVAIVRRLEEAGELTISRGEGDVVYCTSPPFAFEQLQPVAPNLRADADGRGPSASPSVEALHSEARSAGEAEGARRRLAPGRPRGDRRRAGRPAPRGHGRWSNCATSCRGSSSRRRSSWPSPSPNRSSPARSTSSPSG